MSVQDLLHGELARRVNAAAAGLDRSRSPRPTSSPGATAGAEQGPTAGRLPDLARLAAAEAQAPDLSAIAVLRRFDPAVFARSSLEFALGLDAARADGWFRAFTRTVFLIGNPANLAERFRFNQVADDGSIAWFGPASSAECTGLRRLLKLFAGTAEPTPPAALTVVVPGAVGDGGRNFELFMATAGLTMTDYLVHLNHTLAEAALTRTIRPGDRLRLRHVPRLAEPAAPYSVLRVHRDNHDPSRLRAYTCLRPGQESQPTATDAE